MTTKDVNAAIWAIEAPEAVKRGILGPMYTRSIDASMAVIVKRWPVFRILIGADRIECSFGTHYWSASGFHGGMTHAHALALALLAALEAETKP